MNKDPKTNFILMMAIGLTLLLVMQYVFPPPEPEAPAPAAAQHVDRPVAVTAPAGTPVNAPAPASARDFAPEGDYTITVRAGGEGKDEHGYEATFSTVGGGLSSYRLLGYYRVPENEDDSNRVVLLDRLADGRDSLRVDSVTYGAARQSLVATPMGGARYELLEIPAAALVEPRPAGVKIGDNLVMRTVAGDWELTRTYRFPNADAAAPDFTLDFDMEWRNIADSGRLLNYSLVGPAGIVPDDESGNFGLINFLSARQPNAASNAVEVERAALPGLEDEDRMTGRDNRANLAWIGAKNRFFTAIMTASREALTDSNGATRLLFAADARYLPTAEDMRANMAAQPQLSVQYAGQAPVTVPAFGETSLTVEPGLVEPGAAYAASYRLYAGPAVDEWMEAADPRVQGVVSYTISYLDFISRWLVRALNFLHGILGNYGVAIIALTILIKLALHPLNRKSFVSMNKMSKLAPKMKELQARYANDRVKLQQEMSRFYKENGVSMAGGCLPMFLQLPIFFALYGAFSQGFAMRHAPFLSPWIMDLSKPDMVYDFGWQIPLLQSSYLSLLPIVYLGAQYFQMSLQPTPADPQQAQQQKMMKFMPLLFVFFFYAMPAGLVLYFTVSSLVGITESLYMRKIVLPRLGLGNSPEAAAVAAATTQAGAGAAAVPSDKKKKQRRR